MHPAPIGGMHTYTSVGTPDPARVGTKRAREHHDDMLKSNENRYMGPTGANATEIKRLKLERMQ
jgi:hypothetical protein